VTVKAMLWLAGFRISGSVNSRSRGLVESFLDRLAQSGVDPKIHH
jgi:hypothetical protein